MEALFARVNITWALNSYQLLSLQKCKTYFKTELQVRSYNIIQVSTLLKSILSPQYNYSQYVRL